MDEDGDGDGEAHSMTPKRQRHSLEYERCDRLSNLPDSLLFHILSFLKMEDVMKTTLLSRRWRYFWTTTTCLNFKASSEMIKTEGYEAFVDRALVAYKGSKIKKFRLRYFYRPNSNAFQVDSWIHFAIWHNVEEFELDFICGMRFVPTELENFNSLYKVHSSCFNSASLTRLTLRFCALNVPTSMCLSSLKVLSLELLELSHDTINELTSSCPILEELFLKRCNRKSDLNIYIPELSLKSLTIEEYFTCDYLDTAVEIYAPNLLSLEFLIRMHRSKYHYKGPSSLLKVCFDCEGVNKLYGEDDGHVLAALLKDLHCVEDLKVDAWSIQTLTIAEVQSLPILSLNATSLELSTGLSKWELPGIAYMLRSCPLLQTLVITLLDWFMIMQFTQEFTDKYDYDIREYWKSQEFCSVLRSVKTITLLLFSKEEYFCPLEDEAKAMEELFEGHEIEIELVRCLLQHCKLLEKMIITRPKYNPLAGKPLELPPKFEQKLLDFPRASPAARLIFM